MTWIVFTPAEFTAYHDAQCASRGIPKPGRIQKTGAVAVDHEWTTAFSITAVYKGKSYTVTPSGVDATKPKPTSITIDGVTYTRSR